jgi:hypothetical protein
VMEHELFRVMVQSLGQAGCVSLVRARLMPWTSTPPPPAETEEEIQAAADHARECGEAIGAILLQGSDRPVLRRQLRP